MKNNVYKNEDVILVDELMTITEQSWPQLCAILRINDLPEPIIHGTNTICWSRNEIEQWMDDYENKVNHKRTKYYGVRRGAQTGVFTSWPQVQNLIYGYSYPKYKGFNTREEAQAYVDGE